MTQRHAIIIGERNRPRFYDAETLQRAASLFEYSGNLQRVSHSGMLLALLYEGATDIAVVDMSTWEPVSVPSIGELIRDVAFSPDGAYLAVSHAGDGLTVYDTSGWSTETIAALPGAGTAVRFSPDSSLLAVGHEGGDGMTVLDVSTWTAESDTPTLEGPAVAFAWRHDGEHIAVSIDDSSVLPEVPVFPGGFSLVNGFAMEFGSGALKAELDTGGSGSYVNAEVRTDYFSMPIPKYMATEIKFEVDTPDFSFYATGRQLENSTRRTFPMPFFGDNMTRSNGWHTYVGSFANNLVPAGSVMLSVPQDFFGAFTWRIEFYADIWSGDPNDTGVYYVRNFRFLPGLLRRYDVTDDWSEVDTYPLPLPGLGNSIDYNDDGTRLAIATDMVPGAEDAGLDPYEETDIMDNPLPVRGVYVLDTSNMRPVQPSLDLNLLTRVPGAPPFPGKAHDARFNSAGDTVLFAGDDIGAMLVPVADFEQFVQVQDEPARGAALVETPVLYTIEGVIRDSNGDPALRRALLVHREGGTELEATMSEGGTPDPGYYRFVLASAEEFDRIAIADDAAEGQLFNDLIDRILPS